MTQWKWFGALGLLLASCSGRTGVLVDIGSWPAGAVSLHVDGTLNGAPSSETLAFDNGTTRFVVYLHDQQRGQLELKLTAIDENACPRATASTKVEVGSGLRSIAEASVMLVSLDAPYCPAPTLSSITPALAPTSGELPATISGQNFLPGAKLFIDGVMIADAIVVSPTSITATLPERLGAFGPVSVEVRNPDGQVASRVDLFGYYASQFGYSAMTNFGAGNFPRAAIGGDFNQDGKQDIVVANGGSTLSILLGDGKGGFAPANNIPTGPNATYVVAADFNSDKNLDCAVATYGSNSLSLLLGDGKGGFAPYTNLPGFGAPAGMALGDFNGDGALDLAVADIANNVVNVALGNSKGGFGTIASFGTGKAPGAVGVGDWNGDAKVDLAVANTQDSTVSILLGDGQGGFAKATSFATDNNSSGMAVGDWNGDKKLDLAISNAGPGNVCILLGDGQGGFGATTKFQAGNSPYAVATADLDGDQNLDLAFANNGSSKVTVLLGDGKGSFGTAASVDVGQTPYWVATGDWNGDKKPDLVTANYNADTVTVLLNHSK